MPVIFAYKRIVACSFGILVLLSACKKNEGVKHSVENVEYRFITSDPNIYGFGVIFRVTDQNGLNLDYNFTTFNNVIPGDTNIFRLDGRGTSEFLNSVRTLEMKVGHKNKVYSPVLAAAGVYVEGNPYLVGWHSQRKYVLRTPDTVHTTADRIRYIHLPTDTTKFKEVL